MAAYSLDLRQRVLRARDSGMKVEAIAATFDVSVAWVYRLVQRRRETGSIAPRKQTKFRGRALSSDDEVRLVALITVKPDATLAELQDALPTRAALSTLWRTIDRLGLTVKKKRYTPTSSDALTSPPIAGDGRTRSHCTTPAPTSSSTNRA
jgi:transposase